MPVEIGGGVTIQVWELLGLSFGSCGGGPELPEASICA